jgi:N-acetylneuraminate synthase/sialic acid synthase
MREMWINGRRIADDTDAYVIAEIGHNHGGDEGRCREMFKAARECGCDAVKLQKRDNKRIFTPELYNAPYVNPNSYGATYGEHREALEFNREQFERLKAYADSLGIAFICTAFDEGSADILSDIGIHAFKIASGDMTNTPLIRHIALKGLPVIMSTGGGDMDDLMRAYFSPYHITQNRAILHCVATYPNKPEQLNLRMILTLRSLAWFFGAVIGFSDHYNGICMAETAYVLGARIIEKHFTLDHTWKGTDQALSLEPQGMRRLVRDLRRIRVAMGDGVKRKLPEEDAAIHKMGKSIYAARDISAREVLTRQDMEARSPAGGLPPRRIDDLVGVTVKEAMVKGQMFTEAT